MSLGENPGTGTRNGYSGNIGTGIWVDNEDGVYSEATALLRAASVWRDLDPQAFKRWAVVGPPVSADFAMQAFRESVIADEDDFELILEITDDLIAAVNQTLPDFLTFGYLPDHPGVLAVYFAEEESCR